LVSPQSVQVRTRSDSTSQFARIGRKKTHVSK
jgi:hypothetical protein